jgi:hypothetical protein
VTGGLRTASIVSDVHGPDQVAAEGKRVPSPFVCRLRDWLLSERDGHIDEALLETEAIPALRIEAVEHLGVEDVPDPALGQTRAFGEFRILEDSPHGRAPSQRPS